MQMISETLISVSAHLYTHKLYKREMEERMNSGREILEFLKRRKKLEKRVAEMKGGGLAEGKNVPREKRK